MNNHALRFFIASLLLLMSALGVRVHAQNLLVNPGLEDDALAGRHPGWGPFWVRVPGTGGMMTDTSVFRSGQASLKIVHVDTSDWSAPQTALVPVTAGDIVTFGAWIKCENTDIAQICLVARGADGTVLNWMTGLTGTAGTHDWQQLSQSVVIPAGCATVQFRCIGAGKATVWLDDADLVKVDSAQNLQTRGRLLRLENRVLSVSVAPTGLLTVTDKRTGRAWHQQQADTQTVVTDAKRLGPAALSLSLWDVPDDLHLHAALSLAADAPELTVTLSGDGAVHNLIAYPQPFVSDAGTWLIVPLNEGILYPVDDATIPAMQLLAYTGHGLCMPWYGVTEPSTGAGLMTILGTPDDARVEITRQTGTGLFVRPLWEESWGRLRYGRKLTYVFFDQGGYVAQAKRYRLYAKHVGLFKTLAQKRTENPNVDKLIGAVDLWYGPPDRVAFCRELKTLGMDHVLWSSGGSPTEVAAINAMGYLTSRYDVYQDVWPPDAPSHLQHEGWPDDLVRVPGGDWLKGWQDIETRPDGTQTIFQAGVINSARGLARAERIIPAELKTTPLEGRFIDTTTASPFREDYSPAHPLTRSDDKRNKMALLGFCSGPMHLVVGTETGIDPSVPYVDYYEGMMSLVLYRLPDAGYDLVGYRAPTPNFLKFQVGHFYRIPLWELVYHDCVVANWYWGDATNKSPEAWPTRDLYDILYGTPPLFLFDKAGWDKNEAHFVQTYKSVCPLVRRLGYDEMVSHAFLSPDHAVQRTVWRSGTEITVNFGATDARLPDGRTIKAMSSMVSPPQPSRPAR